MNATIDWWKMFFSEEAVSTTMLQVTLYSKAGCHLCDEARTHLEELATTHEIVIDEIDIRRDTTLFDQYRYRIPVIVVDGIERLEGRIEASQIISLVAP